MSNLITKLPFWLIKVLQWIKYTSLGIVYAGKGRFCPICERSSRKFHHFGSKKREDAQCVHCGSVERHRLFWLYLLKETNLFDGAPKKMLHVAPEPCFERRFKARLKDHYLTADLFSPAMVKMDIMDIQYPDQTFDIIYCSHVLEHVQDDKKAMREFFRVLKTDGWAILLVPIDAEKTFEDPAIVEPAERLKAFGQEDHVRRYGEDYVDRLRESGFKVRVAGVNDLVDEEEAVKMGLTKASGKIYFCTK